MKRLQDKVILITGAGGGIGSACVERFSDEGAIVVAADLVLPSVEKLANRFGDRVIPVQVDIGDEQQFREVIDGAVARLGRLDVLFNNAALTDPATQHLDTTATDIPMDLWRRTLEVNVTGTFVGCRHAIPHMLRQGKGNIINTASIGANAGDSVRVAYCTSKIAIVGLTKNLATQYGKRGIRCNAIAPGPIVTENFHKVAPELGPMLLRHALTPELGVPADIAALAAYLAADESRFMTGQCLTIDGGIGAHHPHTADFDDYLASLGQGPGT
ncbi:MAG: SDR family oxidoreductase [Porticoccaceae bacterium]|jgi:NAD(P)-dependent dehydrogenase (short-subunit alcohol dehydrogenase family)|nr:SDR family oxidoreductase [Porticoccaceae bacterium]MEA3300120.1 SDR family oxidoreductase [Pseudomonadota bacterium]HLS99372.1 SDR family oxidoreductase [Porticoccaceae bacterium]